MLFSQFIIVSGLVFGYMLMLGLVGFIAYVAFEIMLMKARGVKIVRKKRR